MKTILVVDDEEDIVELISVNLEREGYKVLAARNGEDAMELLKAKKPDLIVLDLMLPGIQGLEVCKYIRWSGSELNGIPILILSAKANEVDRILGFEMGADDYITKPFSVRELISRIRVALRRMEGRPAQIEPGRTFSHKELSIDFHKYEVMVRGKKIALSPIEMKLLFFLAKNHGRVYTRDQLLGQIWGEEVYVTPRTVDVHVSRLRKLIEVDVQRPDYIVTVTSVGYKFDDSGP
jgi:two-component system alkaline phosphatase synthesis response regulator PhoP